MFLLNAPPLAAFQTQWMPFGCNAPCRVPASLPQSAPVAGDVELADSSPQRDASTQTVKLEHEQIMQEHITGELHANRGLRSSPPPFKGHSRENAALIVPVQFRDVKEEEDDFEALALDSDSDDSVDRDIEEAIQEYLKNKGSGVPSTGVPAAKSPNLPENDADKVKAAQSIAPVIKVKMEPSPIEIPSRCSSPDSVGSDDSFEQSIKEEIEQFLIDKKLNNANESKKAVTSPSAAKLKPKPIKVVEKPSPKQGIKGPAVKTTCERLNLLPKSLKPEICKGNVRLKTASSPARPNVLRALPFSVQCSELSDSSSDDGIEEAIQLYQLEKSRLEESRSSTPRNCLDRDGKSTTNIAMSDVSHCQGKNSPPESQKKMTMDYRKRKLPHVRPAASQYLAGKRSFHPRDERSLENEPKVTAMRRAETAAELMCAEAILDISKAILPSHPESSVLQEKPSAQPDSPYSSDSSVDSDDSIEQEIRTFLARKAQAESLGTTSAKYSPKEHRSEPAKQPPPSNPKAVGTSKRKLYYNKVLLKDSPGKGVESVNVNSSPMIAALPFGLHSMGKTTCPDDSPKPHRQAQDSRHPILQSMESLESSPGMSGGKRKMFMKVRSNCSGDKSSSLDSDEDLDSAIKDLLRSKRKCKKRPKDSRPQCKKKVRFGETTTRALEMVSGTEQKDCTNKLLVRSCLVNANDTKENFIKKSKTNFKLKEERKVPVGNTESSSVTKPDESKPACASDKSVKKSSALPKMAPETQDSSSVDSDDSIEQEIRKFLAERARESAELSGTPRTPTPVIAVKSEPPPVRVPSPAPIIKEPRVLSSSVTETILQKVREKDRSTAAQPAIIQGLYGYKDHGSPVPRQQPTSIAKAAAPLHSVIVKRECSIEQNRMARPAEKMAPATPDRVLLKAGVNGSPGNLPISGNFVAGLKYISGTEQQLLLNVGKTGAARVATDFYNRGGPITQAVQKKTLILEQPKYVQAPAFSLGAPMVRPALYVVTTKVVQETSASLCLPINAAAYDTGLNLMSIQYCPGQVASHTSACTAPFSFQQTQNGETMMVTPGKAGEIPTLITKARPSQTMSGLLDGDGRFAYVTERAAEDREAGASWVKKEEL